jgi:hypothetical protein
MSITLRSALMMATVELLVAGTVDVAYGQADSGSRVRITDVHSHKRMVGTLISADSDSLRLTSSKDQSVLTVPTRSVARLERSRGQRPSTGRGALIGALAGGGTGLLLGIAASTESDSWVQIGGGEVAAVTVIFGLGGAGIGALIGSASHHEQWDSVPIPGWGSASPAAKAGPERRTGDAMPTVR